MNYKNILFEISDSIAEIKLNRSELLNSFNYEMADEFLDALKKCDKNNQASRILGNSAYVSIFKLNLPLLKKSIIVAVLLIFVDIFKELPLTLILRPFNFDTLATLTYDLNSQAQLHESAIPALLIILVTIPPIIFLNNQLDDRL